MVGAEARAVAVDALPVMPFCKTIVLACNAPITAVSNGIVKRSSPDPAEPVP